LKLSVPGRFFPLTMPTEETESLEYLDAEFELTCQFTHHTPRKWILTFGREKVTLKNSADLAPSYPLFE
jgi:hypothetical protein